MTVNSSPDLVLCDAVVRTVDPAHPVAEAVAIADGAEIRGLAGPRPLNPLKQLYTAVTRRGHQADQPACVSEQVINIEDAVYAYTMGSAYANFCEDNRGSISPGKYADLVVLSQDIYRVDPDQIKDTNIDLTMVDGEIAYSR